MFNALLKWLSDEVAEVTHDGTATVVPPFAANVLQRAFSISAPRDFISPPSPRDIFQPYVREVLHVAGTETSPWLSTQALVIKILSSFSCLSDRIAFINLLGGLPLPPLQYVDDLTVVCGSYGALVGVVGKHSTSACSKYARRVKAAFNYGTGKSAVMAMFNAPVLDAEWLGCDFVNFHRSLGVLVDTQLSFEPFLQECWLDDGLHLLNCYMLA